MTTRIAASRPCPVSLEQPASRPKAAPRRNASPIDVFQSLGPELKRTAKQNWKRADENTRPLREKLGAFIDGFRQLANDIAAEQRRRQFGRMPSPKTPEPSASALLTPRQQARLAELQRELNGAQKP